MCDFEFHLPENKEELLESSSNAYYVKDVCVVSLIRDQLKQARDAFNYDGPEGVLNHFNVYYSVIHHGTKLDVELISKALTDLMKPCQHLSTHLGNILEENEVAEELKLKTLNVLKMLVYLCTQISMLLETKMEIRLQSDLNAVKKGLKGRAKSKRTDEECIDAELKLKQLGLLLNILQHPIFKLWDPPVTEEQFTKLIADVCFAFLINPSIKTDKDLSNMIFYIFGTLIKNYNYSWTFTVRLTQAIKYKEHLQSIIPEGIKILVTEYKCTGLVRQLVRELTEWQSEESFQDAPGARHCSAILTEMTALMPNLMLPEVVFLLKYLNSTSYTLRNCIISIITEVIITVLTNENISEEQIEIRNKLLSKLLAYLWDTNAHVRSKVLQQWIRLHREEAIPKDMQMDVLRKASGRLQDKGTLVRKYALQLMSVFLKHNIYTAILDIDVFQKDLGSEVEKYNLILKMPDDMMEQFKNKEVEWDHIKEELLKVVTECLEDEEKENDMEVELNNKSKDEIKSNILEGKYKEAFFICKEFVNETETNMEEMEEMPIEKRAHFYVTFMQSIYTNLNKVAEQIVNMNVQRLAELTPEETENLKKCDENIRYLKDVISFLTFIENEVFPLVIDMLKSSVMSDVTEAIAFIVTAHEFKMKRASQGLAAMLEQMNTTEQERKKLVIDAYGSVFLTYDGPSKDRPVVIVNTLIQLLQNVNASDLQYLSTVVKQWAEKGDLDHAVIQQFWHMFIGQVTNVVDDDRLSALQFLVMVAQGKRTIIERNMNLVAEIVFSDKCLEDPRYLMIGCNMISNMEEQIDVNSERPCFRVALDDVMWNHLVEKVVKLYHRKDPFCHSIIVASVNLIYKICQCPDVLVAKLLKNIIALMKEPNSNIVVADKVDSTHLALLCHLVGEIAIRQFAFLDVTLYKELKRRNNIRDERKKTQKDSKKKDAANVSKASASCRTPLVNTSQDDNEDSFLEGAQADDAEADFILKVCETELVSGNLLGQYAPMFAFIIRNCEKFDNEELQSSAALALIRFMIISTQLCTKYLHLIMETLQTTKYSSTKNNIFISLADLLHRFPNLVEPESKHMFQVVKDKDETVRMTAVSILSKLIMEDMLRVKETIADLALCIVDESPVMVKMTEEFFYLLAQKGNTIYNVLPDVFAKLSHDKNQIDQNIFKKVMTFLIQLISKDKQIESLVEKLCLRFKLSDKPRVWRDVAYCLTLLNYNEKSLLRLKDNFANYKNCLEDDTVYELLLSIVTKHRNSTKDEMKTIVRALDQQIRTGAVIADDVLDKSKTNKKSTRGRKKKARVQFDDDEDD